MYPYPKSVTPAVQGHLDAQITMVNDLSRSMTQSIQNVFQANLQLGQTLFEEAISASGRLLSADRAVTGLSDVAAHAQPTADKIRAYQQHISRIAANTQVELARVAERHVPETSRTAHELADEVKRVVTEETERGLRQQEENLKNFRDPFQQAETRAGDFIRDPGKPS